MRNIKEFSLLNGKVLIWMTDALYADHVNELEAASEYLFKKLPNLGSLAFVDCCGKNISMQGAVPEILNYHLPILWFSKEWTDFDEAIKAFEEAWKKITKKDIEFNKAWDEEIQEYGD